jgi:hypothetical protein
MRTLLVLWGESYRSGPHMSDIRGTNDYLKRQIMASKSHISLANELKKIDHQIDLLITTYKLNENDDNNLLSFYQKNMNVIKSKFYDNRFPSEEALFNDIFHTIGEVINKKDYDYILFVRIDLYLKKLFLEMIRDYPKNIMFVHIDSNIDVNRKIFNICQQIFSIPKKYFNIIKNKVLYNCYPHRFKDAMISYGVDKDDITYLTPTLHVCSTDFGWNPFYIQVGRSYNKEYHKGCNFSPSVEYYYDNIRHVFIHDLSVTVEKWRNYLETDSLEENLELTEKTFDSL